jgi:hypothetical protein
MIKINLTPHQKMKKVVEIDKGNYIIKYKRLCDYNAVVPFSVPRKNGFVGFFVVESQPDMLSRGE